MTEKQLAILDSLIANGTPIPNPTNPPEAVEERIHKENGITYQYRNGNWIPVIIEPQQQEAHHDVD